MNLNSLYYCNIVVGNKNFRHKKTKTTFNNEQHPKFDVFIERNLPTRGRGGGER